MRHSAACDIVIHSAATVSFDSAIDDAVEVNLLGPVRIVQTLQSLGVHPHLVSVSTCYVAGNRRGDAPEKLVSDGPFDFGIDWRGEVAAARRARADADAASRDPERLAHFRSGARSELGAAGTPALAAKTEQLRQRWVSDQLIQAGRSRASSLGWPDAYAYTKALGERALTEMKGDVPVSIVRPSIIESALVEPRPGWIRGFRMAEPVIISYARGLLKEFPGVPEGTIDVIPVDLVVGAICAVAALGPEQAPPIVQVASGSTNPLRYRGLVDLVHGWFSEHPLYDSAGQPIVVAPWSFPGRGKVQGQLNRAKRALERAEKAFTVLPVRGEAAQVPARLEERRSEVERALSYVELYGAYAECEAIYGVDRLMEVWDSLDDEDRASFAFDPRAIDWTYYVTEVHLPSVVQHARVRTTPGGRIGPDSRRSGCAPGARTRSSSRRVRPREHAHRVERGRVVRVAREPTPRPRRSAAVHREDRPRGADVAVARQEGPRRLPSLLLPPLRGRLGRPARRGRHRADERADPHEVVPRGDPPRPRAPRARPSHAAHHRRARLRREAAAPPVRRHRRAHLGVTADGRYTGELVDVPPTGEARAQVMTDYANAEGLELSESVAYADSSSDLPMLEAVGFPVAVNPEVRLATIARKRGWLVEQWSKSAGASRPLLPIGPPHMTVAKMRRPRPLREARS